MPKQRRQASTSQPPSLFSHSRGMRISGGNFIAAGRDVRTVHYDYRNGGNYVDDDSDSDSEDDGNPLSQQGKIDARECKLKSTQSRIELWASNVASRTAYTSHTTATALHVTSSIVEQQTPDPSNFRSNNPFLPYVNGRNAPQLSAPSLASAPVVPIVQDSANSTSYASSPQSSEINSK
ncbi:hypothetical protein BDQ12DRAFT_669877 [Crucibulum laeve]|uniref:Uncharacterized protein n=1 Tax=Crucibulum laeve TaxID=68775 RepID=A0A5C3LL44_9AGAR|nr:hypothetical protein BDQ12DRAFT_669877 [Crucibulum laeve]